MWYGDSTPSGNSHHKKPLTKSQIKKLQQSYATAGTISESMKILEEREQKKIRKEIEEELKMVF